MREFPVKAQQQIHFCSQPPIDQILHIHFLLFRYFAYVVSPITVSLDTETNLTVINELAVTFPEEVATLI